MLIKKYQPETILSFPSLGANQSICPIGTSATTVTENPAPKDECLVNESSHRINSFLFLSVLKKLEDLGHNTWDSFAFPISKKKC